MVDFQESTARSMAIRQKIESFLNDRLQVKLEENTKKEVREIQKIQDSDQVAVHELKMKNEDKRQELIKKFCREIWLSDIAKRAERVQYVTHVLKYSHPKAEGSNIYCKVFVDPELPVVGTHSLRYPENDVMYYGGAADMPVHAFLSLDFDGKTMLELALSKDPDFLAALTDDQNDAEKWASQFSGVVSSKNNAVSSTLMRQVYFPAKNEKYHLLSPLFPSSLAHYVYNSITEARFSKESVNARMAWKKREYDSLGFKVYPDLVMQKFGGSNPRNFGQFNHERHGISYLLPSLPPIWSSRDIPLPLRVNSVFKYHFLRFRQVRSLTRELKEFLENVQDYNNVNIRRKRAAMVDSIIDELVQYTAIVQNTSPGWTKKTECHLDEYEQLWLDPERGRIDEEFICRYDAGEWREIIRARFARWLNRRLSGKKTPMGDPEFLEWKKCVEGVV